MGAAADIPAKVPADSQRQEPKPWVNEPSDDSSP